MRSQIEARLRLLLREVIPRRLQKLEFEERMSLRADLAIDSIGLLSLAFRIEEEFGLDLSDHAEEVARIETIGDINRFVQRIDGVQEGVVNG